MNISSLEVGRARVWSTCRLLHNIVILTNRKPQRSKINKLFPPRRARRARRSSPPIAVRPLLGVVRICVAGFDMSRSSFRSDPDAAYRPGAPTLPGLSDLADRELLFSGGQACAPRAPRPPVALPGVLGELHAAVEAVPGVNCPIAACLT